MARRVLWAGLALLLCGCTFSLAQDVPPPPGSLLSAETATPVEVTPPEQPPDPANGALIYAQSCSPCHGESGLGDGAQSGNLPVTVPAIGSAELASNRDPMDWFQIVSAGNLDSFMPPFAASLTAQQRWDVLAYVYGLSGDFALDESGARVEAEVVSVPEVTEEAGGEAPAETPESGEATTLLIRGEVANQSGGQTPVGSEVTLYAYDHTEELFRETGIVGAGGVFEFEDMPLQDNILYLTSVEYKGLIYFSEPFAARELEAGTEFDLAVYEGTQDTTTLEVGSLNMVFDFLDDGQVKVVEQVLLSNSGNLAVVPEEDGEALLFYDLPAQAANLSFEQGVVGDRYEFVEGGFVDYRAVLPGQNTYQVLYAFDLPYRSGLEFSRSVQFAAENVHIFLPPNEIELAGEGFVEAGQQLIDGLPYRVYALSSDLAPGDTFTVTLRGRHPFSEDLITQLGDSSFLLGLGALIVVAVGAWLWLRRNPLASPERIMDAIVALDELYKEGDISRKSYERQRETLKGRLRKIMEQQARDD